jgi:hypothetical protein
MLFHLQSLVSIQKDGMVVVSDGDVRADERDSCLFQYTVHLLHANTEENHKIFEF